MIKSRRKARLLLIAVWLVLAAGSCTPEHDFDNNLGTIVAPFRFSIVNWELNTLGEGLVKTCCGRQEKAGDDAGKVNEYFAAAAQIRSLESAAAAVKAGSRQGDLASLEAELNESRQQNVAAADAVAGIIETQIRTTLSQQGIFNPLSGLRFRFPPVYFQIAPPPHLLVISPRDRIESLREIALVPDMGLDDMEGVEGKFDELGFSALVVELGGFATYPSYVTDKGDLRFTIETVVHEWLHQYLAFKPLGFRYLLDAAGIRRDYEIATMNETLVGMVSGKIADMVYENYYARNETGRARPEAGESGFDFNREMREIREAVDGYLARGEIEPAEKFMEQKRQFLAARGYHIRKLNQAYFAFYGTYADSPTSISPIGVELKKLRSRSASLQDFLETAASLSSRQDLADMVE